MKFEDVFKELIFDYNTSIPEISKNTNIDDSILYDYLHGIYPSIKYAVVLANYFGCSLSFLMGVDTASNKNKLKENYNLSLFSQRYDKLLEKNKITHFKLCKLTGLNYSSHYSWRRGASPSMKSLVIISEYFGCSIDYLIGRSDKE